MAARKQAGGSEIPVSRSVQAALVAGVGVVLLATVLNIVLAGMTQSELNDLPYFLSLPYDWSGRLGVTLAVLGVGFSVILLGLIGERLAIWFGLLVYGPGELDYQVGHTPGSARMELQSAKYLRGYHHHSQPQPTYTPPESEVQSEEHAELDHSH